MDGRKKKGSQQSAHGVDSVSRKTPDLTSRKTTEKMKGKERLGQKAWKLQVGEDWWFPDFLPFWGAWTATVQGSLILSHIKPPSPPALLREHMYE